MDMQRIEECDPEVLTNAAWISKKCGCQKPDCPGLPLRADVAAVAGVTPPFMFKNLEIGSPSDSSDPHQCR